MEALNTTCSRGQCCHAHCSSHNVPLCQLRYPYHAWPAAVVSCTAHVALSKLPQNMDKFCFSLSHVCLLASAIASMRLITCLHQTCLTLLQHCCLAQQNFVVITTSQCQALVATSGKLLQNGCGRIQSSNRRVAHPKCSGGRAHGATGP